MDPSKGSYKNGTSEHRVSTMSASSTKPLYSSTLDVEQTRSGDNWNSRGCKIVAGALAMAAVAGIVVGAVCGTGHCSSGKNCGKSHLRISDCVLHVAMFFFQMLLSCCSLWKINSFKCFTIKIWSSCY